MKLAILKERRDGETRVAASPDTVKKLKGLGLDVTVETGRRRGGADGRCRLPGRRRDDRRRCRRRC